MGLFDLFKNKEQPNNSINISNSVDKQNELYKTLNDSHIKYEQDNDLDSLLKTYSYCYFDSGIVLNSQTKALYPAEMCYKCGEYNKAWAYLNRLITTNNAPIEKIRFLQAKILKKEEKYVDAIEMYMLGYLAKSQWNNIFQTEMFEKDIKPCANKLKWNDDNIKYLSYLVGNHIEKQNYDENTLIASYRASLENFKKEQ